jgi:hypothetical protein
VTTWGLTGEEPNPLADLCDEATSIAAPTTATVQELHLIALHMLCCAVDREVALHDGRHARRSERFERAPMEVEA